jgi:serine/threonine-protein kinase
VRTLRYNDAGVHHEYAAGNIVGGRYRLDRLLGEGGMGRVWGSTDQQTGQTVALKIIKDRSGAAGARRRLVREAKAVMALSHPGVVRIFDVLETDDGEPILVMELLVGESLAQRLHREGDLSLSVCAGILVQVVSAVGAAHEKGIIHRDLKPENVFLLSSGNDPPPVKVLDFGIAKLTAVDVDGTPATALTGSGALLGTPRYMAPEQVFGEGAIDHRADIWSLGLILYQCLTGILPTHGENVGQIFKILLTRPIWPIGEVNSAIPADLASMIDRMLAHDPDKRPSDLAEVQHVLRLHTNVRVLEFGSAPRVVPRNRPSSFRPLVTPAEPTLATTPNRRVGRTRLQTRALAVALALGAMAGIVWIEMRDPKPAQPTVGAIPSNEPAIEAAPAVTNEPERRAWNDWAAITAAPAPDPPPTPTPRIRREKVHEEGRRAAPAASGIALPDPPQSVAAPRASGPSVDLDNPYRRK